jgi:TIR domain
LIAAAESAAMRDNDFDLFICHASEDKAEVVRPLADLLRDRGRRVWIDEGEIQLGDSLRQKIDDGLARSRFGLVVLSPAFFTKRWPLVELDGLAAREIISGEKVVLPVWHEVGVEDVALYSPPLAAKLAARTEDGLDAVVDMIERVFVSVDDLAATIETSQAQRSIAPAVGAAEPFLVLAPPSEHRLADPHQVTPPPQVLWAQTAFISVENVGSAVALIRGGDADNAGVGSVTVKAPTAIAPGTTRPVELVVSTMTPDVRIPAGQLLRFWLDYGSGERDDRRLWATAQYNAGGGWANVGYENRSLQEPERTLLPSVPPSAHPDVERVLGRMAFATAQLAGGGADLRLRRWVGSQDWESVKCEVVGHLGQFEVEVAPEDAGGGWVEYNVRFPDSFEAGVAAGHHAVFWRVVGGDEELARDSFRFP